MAREEYSASSKIMEQYTKDGLSLDNLETNESENISHGRGSQELSIGGIGEDANSNSYNRGSGKVKKSTQTKKRLLKYENRLEEAQNRLQDRVDKLPSINKLNKNRRLLRRQVVKGRLNLCHNPVTRLEYNPVRRLQFKDKARRKAIKTGVSVVTQTGKLLINPVVNKVKEGVDDRAKTLFRGTGESIKHGGRIFRKSFRVLSLDGNAYAKLKRAEDNVTRLKFERDNAEYKYNKLEFKEEYIKHREEISKMGKEDKSKSNKEFRKHQRQNKMRLNRGNDNKVLMRKNIFEKVKYSRLVRGSKSFFRYLGLIVSSVSLLFIVFVIVAVIGLIIYASTHVMASGAAAGTHLSSYEDITRSTEYVTGLEANLIERITLARQEELMETTEVRYILNDEVVSMEVLINAITHDKFKLGSYLSAKYIETDFNKIKQHLDSLFNELYQVDISVADEIRYREVLDEYGMRQYENNGNIIMEEYIVKVGIINLKTKPLERIIEANLSEDDKDIYDNYIISGGGQQIYWNCFAFDWSKMISSSYGMRMHPILGYQRMHSGVDIAVPIGTPLYSSSEGKVSVAGYSDSAGNWIAITDSDGWVVKYMHLDSINVVVGQEVNKGQLIGTTGNTGRSTGAHLHLEIRDPNNMSLDPIFMISTAKYTP